MRYIWKKNDPAEKFWNSKTNTKQQQQNVKRLYKFKCTLHKKKQ